MFGSSVLRISSSIISQTFTLRIDGLQVTSLWKILPTLVPKYGVYDDVSVQYCQGIVARTSIA